MNDKLKAGLITALLVIMLVGAIASEIVATIVAGLILILAAASMVWFTYEAILILVKGF